MKTTVTTTPAAVLSSMFTSATPGATTDSDSVDSMEKTPVAKKLVNVEPVKLTPTAKKTQDEEEDERVLDVYIQKIAPVMTVFLLPILFIIELINAYSYICLLKKPKHNNANECNCKCVTPKKQGPTQVWTNKRKIVHFLFVVFYTKQLVNL